MTSVESKSMDMPDETHTPTKLTASVVHLGTATVKRLTAEPGFRWSECIRPLVGGDSCESAHLGYVVSGTLHIASDDGAAADLGPGDAYRIEPGHDAWVLGDEPFIALEFESKTAETNVEA
jgi:hypothetical protein